MKHTSRTLLTIGLGLFLSSLFILLIGSCTEFKPDQKLLNEKSEKEQSVIAIFDSIEKKMQEAKVCEFKKRPKFEGMGYTEYNVSIQCRDNETLEGARSQKQFLSEYVKAASNTLSLDLTRTQRLFVEAKLKVAKEQLALAQKNIEIAENAAQVLADAEKGLSDLGCVFKQNDLVCPPATDLDLSERKLNLMDRFKIAAMNDGHRLLLSNQEFENLQSKIQALDLEQEKSHTERDTLTLQATQEIASSQKQILEKTGVAVTLDLSLKTSEQQKGVRTLADLVKSQAISINGRLFKIIHITRQMGQSYFRFAELMVLVPWNASLDQMKAHLQNQPLVGDEKALATLDKISRKKQLISEIYPMLSNPPQPALDCYHINLDLDQCLEGLGRLNEIKNELKGRNITRLWIDKDPSSKFIGNDVEMRLGFEQSSQEMRLFIINNSNPK